MKSVNAQIKQELVVDQCVLIADADGTRSNFIRDLLVSVGFVPEQVLFAEAGDKALSILSDKKPAIVLVDDSIGMDAYQEIHAAYVKAFGPLGFVIFSITEGNSRQFVHFSAMAKVDGILFRPYREEEFRLRICEAFAIKWLNRVVKPVEVEEEIVLVHGENDEERFQKAIEKEHRLGNRDPLTPDSKVTSIFGLKPARRAALKSGKVSYEKVRLSFRAIARNGTPLKKTFPIHAVEVDQARATFECPSSEWEGGDHVSIEADIAYGDETYLMRIEATVIGEAGLGLMAVEFDEGNRTRFEVAMSMVAKRFKELKDFFKYAKGA